MRKHNGSPTRRKAAKTASFPTMRDTSRSADAGVRLPRPTMPPRMLPGSEAYQDVLGHSATCIALSRRGEISACDCRIRPIEDPAVTVATIVHYVRVTGYGKQPLPTLMTELLSRQLCVGDPACRMVAAWLVELGLLDEQILNQKAGS